MAKLHNKWIPPPVFLQCHVSALNNISMVTTSRWFKTLYRIELNQIIDVFSVLFSVKNENDEKQRGLGGFDFD